MVVGFPAGQATDIVARLLAEALKPELGETVIVDNKPGQGGSIALGLVARAAPDGSTFVLSPLAALAINPYLYKNVTYRSLTSFEPVARVCDLPLVLVVHPSLPVKTLPELIAYAKANPGKLNCGSAGNGTTRHLSCEMFNAAAGIKAEHVPYKGTGPATTALLAGEIDYVFEALGSAAQHIRSGKLKAIAVTSARRSPAFPDVPTAMQQGLPGFEITSWYGLWVPTGTPAAVSQRLHALGLMASEDPEVRDLWARLGGEQGGMPAPEFTQFVRNEVQKWGRVVKAAGVVIE